MGPPDCQSWDHPAWLLAGRSRGRCGRCVSYREVSVVEVKEILRLWLEGRSLREVSRLAAADRKTVRRYVEAAQAAGVDRDDGPAALSDELLAAVIVLLLW